MPIQYYVHYWVQTMFVPKLHVVQIQNEIINFVIPLIYYCDEKFDDLWGIHRIKSKDCCQHSLQFLSVFLT